MTEASLHRERRVGPQEERRMQAPLQCAGLRAARDGVPRSTATKGEPGATISIVTKATAVHYRPKGAFQASLQPLVAAKVRSVGPRARRHLWAKAAFVSCWFYSSVAVLLFVDLRAWQAALISI